MFTGRRGSLDDHQEDDSMWARNLSREILKTQKKELETNVTTQQKKRQKKGLGSVYHEILSPRRK